MATRYAKLKKKLTKLEIEYENTPEACVLKRERIMKKAETVEVQLEDMRR